MRLLKMIKFLDLKKQRDAFHNNLDEIILKVVEAGQFISGPEVKILENTLSNYVGSECITVANGTDALSIALMSIGTGPGDEVILPSFTWVSTAEVVCQLGAKPVFIDIDENFEWTFCFYVISRHIRCNSVYVIVMLQWPSSFCIHLCIHLKRILLHF